MDDHAMDDEKSLSQDYNDHAIDNKKRTRGRPFQKGNSGRKRGSKNKTTLLAASLAAEQGEEILRKAIELAMGGNVTMIKFLLDRILPKERAIPLELPRLVYAPDSVDAMAKIVDAVSSGRISPREAADVAQVVSAFTRAIDVTEVQNAVDWVKDKLTGQNLNLQNIIAASSK
jgi:hypothetical protein